MKFFKPLVIIIAFIALAYTVSAHTIKFNTLGDKAVETQTTKQPQQLPVHGDLLFALTAIASIGGYMALKK